MFKVPWPTEDRGDIEQKSWIKINFDIQDLLIAVCSEGRRNGLNGIWAILHRGVRIDDCIRLIVTIDGNGGFLNMVKATFPRWCGDGRDIRGGIGTGWGLE